MAILSDEKYLQKLGEKILKLREEKNWNQKQFAEKLDTGAGQIRRIEKGQVNSTINMLRKIAKLFGISISELVNIN